MLKIQYEPWTKTEGLSFKTKCDCVVLNKILWSKSKSVCDHFSSLRIYEFIVFGRHKNQT